MSADNMHRKFIPDPELLLWKINAVVGPNGHGPLRMVEDCRQDILGELKASGIHEDLLSRLRIRFLDKDKRPVSQKTTGDKDIDTMRTVIDKRLGPEILRSLELSLRRD